MAASKCGGKKHQGDGLCTRPAGWGTDHPGWGRCKLHGGCAPNGVRAAAAERVNEQASAVLAKLDVPPCTDPLAELEKVVGQVVSWKDSVAGILNTLRDTDLRYKSKMEIEQLRGETALWERALDRAVMALTALSKIHIQEELVRMEERTADMIIAAMTAALARTGVAAGDAQQVAYAEFGKRLKVIAGVAEQAS